MAVAGFEYNSNKGKSKEGPEQRDKKGKDVSSCS